MRGVRCTKQLHETLLKIVLGRHANLTPADHAISPDDHRGWNSPPRRIGLVDRMVRPNHEYRITHPQPASEWRHVLDRSIQGKTDHRETLHAVLVMQPDKQRNLDPAWFAPRSPEVQDNDVALVRRQIHRRAVEITQREIKRGIVCFGIADADWNRLGVGGRDPKHGDGEQEAGPESCNSNNGRHAARA